MSQTVGREIYKAKHYGQKQIFVQIHTSVPIQAVVEFATDGGN